MSAEQPVSVRAICSCVAPLVLMVLCSLCSAQSTPSGQPPLDLTSTATRRFVAVHGRRSLVMGYPQTGLEVWAYPFQILSGYQVAFRPDGSATETDGRLLLRRVIERPDSITRIYAGPDYVIRETIFVPLKQPAAVITYQIDSSRTIYINAQFKPILNLMWPGALGGQSTSWDSHLPGYLLEEPAHHLRAVIASPQIVLHDDTVNSTLRSSGNLSFALKPHTENGGSSVASIYVALLDSSEDNPISTIQSLETNTPELEDAARDHYAQLTQNALHISTPDDRVNSALAWAEVALDQAWVCNPQLGCATVGGYGPSRDARRPQYAWFFAGDELVAANALISAGEFARARDELLFIEKYQDRKTGMIWHELSQSAAYIDWSSYPYMFVHVDISFDYLNTLARFVTASGDNKFAVEQWTSINAAYHYCLSLIGSDGLPHIPAGKEGADEQHRPAEDLGLSVSWVAAASSYAMLAKAAGHPQFAEGAAEQSRRARHSIAAHSWDAEHHFWINGTTVQGKPIFTRRSGPADAITENIFSPQQNTELLNQIASSIFRTDWGVRSVGTDSVIYNPWSYASGSVSALHSAEIASMFWTEGRPEIAWSIWRGIVPWNTLDSLGHIHEVVAGNYYREQTESVPEQTWSSAGFLDAAVRGLLGLTIRGADNSAVFRPSVPTEWDHISIDNIRLPHSTLTLTMRQSIDSIDLDIKDRGAPTTLTFEPQIPLGARLADADCGGNHVSLERRPSSEAEYSNVRLSIPSGSSHCRLHFVGGVSVILPPDALRIGDASSFLKLTRVAFQHRALTIHADVRPTSNNILTLRTPWKIFSLTGASVQSRQGDFYTLRIEALKKSRDYIPAVIRINFTE